MMNSKGTAEDNSGLTLFGTEACHLCDLAEQLLRSSAGNSVANTYQKCDVSLSDDLFETYGLRIPVLRDASGRELDWPFDEVQLVTFLGN